MPIARHRPWFSPVSLLLASGLALAAGAAPASAHRESRVPDIIIPSIDRIFPREPAQHVRLTHADASITFADQVATTELVLTLSNPTGAALESQLILPVPEGAVLRAFQLEGPGLPTLEARLLPRDEARRVYEEIVRKLRDPGLVEIAGLNLIRTSVFPVPANAIVRARLTYEQVLKAESGRIDYALPRSESLRGSGVTWTYAVRATGARPISALYSPSHELAVTRQGPAQLSATVTPATAAAAGPLRLSLLSEPAAGPLAASLIAYPDPEAGGGYFMLLAAPAPTPADRDARAGLLREITLVLDRSGSMQGEKFEQARNAALQVVTGLAEGERFNLIDYSDTIASFAPQPLAKDPAVMDRFRAYLSALRPVGGTNIHDALLESLRPAPAAGQVPIVLFLTDGLPTVGRVGEHEIRSAATASNPHARRVFTFGVGHDVNAPLLSSIAADSRGATTFVQPGEDVEARVGQVFRRLTGPVLASPALAAAGEARPVNDMLPATLPDVFEGDQLVLVGRYSALEPGSITLTLTGAAASGPVSVTLSLDPAQASVQNGYVARLWAGRKIGSLIDQIRRLGAGGIATSDPRIKELVDEVTRLSTRFGILTEYTAFLAAENQPIASLDDLSRRVTGGLAPAVAERSGAAAVRLEENLMAQSAGRSLSVQNVWTDAQGKRVQVQTVQVANDRALFQRLPRAGARNAQRRWVDAELMSQISAGQRRDDDAPDQTIEFASPEYFRLADRLAAQQRQAVLAQDGQIELLVDGQRVLVQPPQR
jgi:Ca-activated chloride channel family protein